jgi:hypothetical protein
LLVNGSDFIPHEILKEAWRSARHGVAYIVDVEAIRKPHVIGLDEEGKIVEERQTYTVELVSKARRIRYSRHFFPEKVSELRARLFAELEQESMEQPGNEASSHPESASEAGQVETDKPVESEPKPVERSSWSLLQCEEFTQDYKEYKRRCRKALLEALIDIRTGQRNLSRRVINIWAYQRSQLRWAS